MSVLASSAVRRALAARAAACPALHLGRPMAGRHATAHAAAATSLPRLYSSSTLPGGGETLEEELERMAQRSQTSVSLKATLDTGLGLLLPEGDSGNGMTRRQRTLLQIATFLKRELPVRLARRVVELKALPEGLDQMPSVKRVREWYEHSFVELRTIPSPTTLQEEAQFAELLHRIYERHAPTLVTMARGVHELKQKLREERGPDYDLSDAAEIHGCAGRASQARGDESTVDARGCEQRTNHHRARPARLPSTSPPTPPPPPPAAAS